MEDVTQPSRVLQPFRPSRSRASLSALPDDHRPLANENAPSTSALAMRRKRAQSLGGADAQALKRQKPLSPAKLARRSLAPRRSILKAPAVHDQTATLDQAGGSSSDEGETMDFTRTADDTTMARRRVSFAPNAHIRTFSPQKKTALAQNEVGDSSTDDSFSSEQSMEMDTTRIFSAASSSPSLAHELEDDEEEQDDDDDDDDDEDDNEMDFADDEVTSAFAAATFASQQQQQQQQRAQGHPQQPRFSEVFRTISASAEEIRRASQEEAVVPPPEHEHGHDQEGLNPESILPEHRQQQFGETARHQDAEDEQINRALQRAFSQPPLSTVEEGEQEDKQNTSSEEDDDDEEVAMELTTVMGRLSEAGSEFHRANEEEDEVENDQPEDDGDMTGRTIEMEDLTSTSQLVDATSTSMVEVEMTTTMVEATSYGRILPTTPAERRRQDHLFRRLSLTGSIPLPAVSPRLHSPRRGVPAMSPRRGVPLTVDHGPSPFNAVVELSKQPVLAPTVSPKRHPSPNKGAASPNKTDRRRTLSPVKKPQTPSRLALSPSKRPVFQAPLSAGRSPGGSLSLRGLLQEQLARNEDPLSEDTGSSFGPFVEEAPSKKISLDQFIEESGTGFMQDVLKMTGVDLVDKRRKSIASLRPPSGPPTFADLAVAGGCKALFHQLYQSDQYRLQEDIQMAVTALAQVDEAVQHDYPTIFAEWTNADEDHRAVMTSQFRMIKSFYYLAGRVEWNETRSSNHEQIINVMEETLEGLRADNAIIARSAFEDVLPGLQQRRAALIKELQDEQTRDLELTACDQDELAELHAALAEQGEQLKIHGRQYAEVEGQLVQLQSRAAELADQEAQQLHQRDRLHRILEEGQCFTKAEVFRLRAEHEALQHLHGWTLEQFTASAVKIRHLNEFDVVLQIASGVVQGAELALVAPPPHGLMGDLTHFLFSKLVGHVDAFVGAHRPGLVPRSVVSHIASMWTVARRLRQEMVLAHHRYPTTATETEAGLRISTEVHLPSAKATLIVVFGLTGEELLERVDEAAARIGCEIELKFGRLGENDLKDFQYAITDRVLEGGWRAVVEALDAAEAKGEKKA